MVRADLEAPEYQEDLVDNLLVNLAVNLENLVAIRLVDQDLDFQADDQAVPNQVGSNLGEDFHRVKDLPADILVDAPQYPFRAVNRPADRVQEQVQVDIHPVAQARVNRVGQASGLEGFQRDLADILVVDLVDKHRVFQAGRDIRAVHPVKENPRVPGILADGQVDKDQAGDIPVDKLLEVIPVKHRSLVAREVDILVEGPALAIQGVLRDLAVVQVLKDQADIQDQEDQAALKVLEVSKAQVEYLPAVILVLDQVHKDQEVIRVGQVRKDREGFQVDQVRKGLEDSQVHQGRKGQEDFRLDQALVIR